MPVLQYGKTIAIVVNYNIYGTAGSTDQMFGSVYTVEQFHSIYQLTGIPYGCFQTVYNQFCSYR